MNSHILKITGGAELSNQLEASQTVHIDSMDLDIYEVAKKDNFDGTFSIIYKTKISSEIELQQSGKVIRGKDKSKKSKKLRGAIYFCGKEEGELDSDQYYDRIMDLFIRHTPEIIEFVKKLDKKS